MNIPSEFDPIRPFNPEELPAVYDRLLADPQFQQVITSLFPGVSLEDLGKKMKSCKTNLEFQKAFCYPVLQDLIHKASFGCSMDASSVNINHRYTFVSNHRDIVLDSALLDKLLLDVGFSTTCEIAIGDNLLTIPWVKDLVRINKSFTVERALHAVEMYKASKRMSEYMHFVISEKNENVWIAQREGRSKDSTDNTQAAILKMMVMGGEGSIIDRLAALHIVPLTISYEYDPCDYLKAREFQLKRDVPFWKKTPGDDIESMSVGIKGFKGHIQYHCAPCINDWLRKLNASTPKNQLFDSIAKYIDTQIHYNYRLYPGNYVALDMLQGNKEHDDMYSPKQRSIFEQYINGQLAKIDIENKDEKFLRECLLNQYANPVKNYYNARDAENSRLKSLMSKLTFKF